MEVVALHFARNAKNSNATAIKMPSIKAFARDVESPLTEAMPANPAESTTMLSGGRVGLRINEPPFAYFGPYELFFICQNLIYQMPNITFLAFEA